MQGKRWQQNGGREKYRLVGMDWGGFFPTLKKILIMKFLSLSLALLFAAVLHAQKDIVIDWKTAPKNPIAIYYTLNHDGLLGRVKKVTETASNTDKIRYWTYDENGLYKYGVDSSGILRDEYVARYLAKVVGILRKTLHYKDKLTAEYDRMGFRNTEGVIDNVQESDKRSVTQWYFTFDKKGAIVKAKGGKSEKNYKYNKKGQLTEEVGLWEGKPEYTSVYEYKQEGEQLVVVIRSTNAEGGSVMTEKYNKSGQVTEYIFNRAGFEERGSYEFDKEGNWIIKIVRDVQLSTGKAVSEYVVGRKIEYY